MKTISITTKDITSTKSNQFRYEFPSDVSLTNKEIGLASLSMFYSMFLKSVILIFSRFRVLIELVFN